MSTERPILRPFDGLGGMEALTSAIRLRVRDLHNDMQELEPGMGISYPSEQISDLGLVLRFEWAHESIRAAREEAGLEPCQIDVIVVAEDRLLKERALLHRWSMEDVPADFVVSGLKAARPEALQNTFKGFEILVAVVLAEERSDPVAFRPHRQGTILASAEFTVRADRSSGGLDPLPLDDETRERHRLPPSTVLFVEQKDSLLDAEDVSRSLAIYFHETLYTELGATRGPERSFVLRQMGIDAWCQIVHMVRDELDDDFEWDGTTGAVLRSLYTLARSQLKSTTHTDLVDMIKNDPSRLCAIISGSDRQAQKALALVGDREDRS